MPVSMTRSTDIIHLHSERLGRCYSGIVYDVMREHGHANCVLPPQIQSLKEGQTLAGPVFTVSGQVRTDLTAHETLLRWTEFLSAAPPGSVVVCQPNDDERAHMGELSSEALSFRGVKGYIVDGGCRDVAFIRSIGFPVFCRYRTPRDTVGTWIPTRLGEPIIIGTVTIENGDYALADADGVIVVPSTLIDGILERAETMMATENLVRKAILEGEDPREAYLKYRKF